MAMDHIQGTMGDGQANKRARSKEREGHRPQNDNKQLKACRTEGVGLNQLLSGHIKLEGLKRDIPTVNRLCWKLLVATCRFSTQCQI